MPRGTKIPLKVKHAAIRAAQETSVAEAAEEFGVSTTSISRWKKKHRPPRAPSAPNGAPNPNPAPATKFTQVQIAGLVEENRKLRALAIALMLNLLEGPTGSGRP